MTTQLTDNPAGKGRGCPRPRSGGFTLIELMFALAIGSVIALVSLGGLVEGMHLFSSTSTEMIARDAGSRAIRQITTDMLNASQVSIYPNYLSLSGSSAAYGSCAVIQTPSSNVAYYLYAASSTDPNSGGIYYCPNATLGPNPATDTLLVSSVQDFEFRTDTYPSIRVGFKIGIYGYPTFLVGSKEPDLVRFTTSNVPRNM